MAAIQSGASGSGWTSGTFYPLSTDNPVSPYTHRRDFFPNGAGNGGILAVSTQLLFRKVGTNETATFPFTPANTPFAVPRQVSAGTTNLPTWAQSFDSAYAYDTSSRNFTAFANSNVANLKVAISQDGAFGDGWQSGEFYTLPQQSGSGYTHRRDFNRGSSGQPGVSSAPVVMAFRSVDAGTTVDDVQTAAFTPAQAALPVFPGPIGPLPTSPKAPEINLPTATVGQSYSFIVPAFIDLFNRPITYTVTGLPSGLTFNPAARIISGTPTSAGTSTIQITATNRLGRQTTVSVTLTVAPLTGNRPPVAPSVGTQMITVNTAYTFVIPAFTDPDNDPLTYSASGLPAWLSFNAGTRTLSGTPTATGNYTATITANDGRGGITPLVVAFTVNSQGGNSATVVIRRANSNIMYLQTAPVTLANGQPGIRVTNSSTYNPGTSYHLYFYESGNIIGIDTFPALDYPRGSRLMFHCKQASSEEITPVKAIPFVNVGFSAQTEIYIS